MATEEQQELRRRIAGLQREAELLRSNPPAAQAAEREREAASCDFQVGVLQDVLQAELQAERAQLVQDRDSDLVRVRWLRDGPPEGTLIDDRRYNGRGPVRQRLGQAASTVATVAREVEVQAAEEQVMPRAHAEVLSGAGYVQVLGPAAAEAAG